MKRVVRKLASVSKPHIYWSGNRWSVMYLRGADHQLVSAAMHFVCRLNEPDRLRRELEAAVALWSALP